MNPLKILISCHKQLFCTSQRQIFYRSKYTGSGHWVLNALCIRSFECRMHFVYVHSNAECTLYTFIRMQNALCIRSFECRMHFVYVHSNAECTLYTFIRMQNALCIRSFECRMHFVYVHSNAAFQSKRSSSGISEQLKHTQTCNSSFWLRKWTGWSYRMERVLHTQLENVSLTFKSQSINSVQGAYEISSECQLGLLVC